MVLRRATRLMFVGLLAACGPGKQDPPDTGTGSTDGTSTATDPTSSGGSLSHSATSADPPTSSGAPPTTADPSLPDPTGTATSNPATTGADTTLEPGTTDTTGPAGVMYGPCEDREPRCAPGLDCAVFEELVEDLVGNYCTPPCGPRTPCPPSSSGTVAQCGLILDGGTEPTHCLVLCDPTLPDPSCPAGTMCTPAQNRPPVGICLGP
ncbi:hypothetical protein [Nannocystis radixulma]|uniref:Uncharacterized protein n=1 Tax=Nannocystis radixulma TaxID=2995305 RepID=A0ABT5AX45_9BACT|nr:hypothetical protein [Nannocystis radixulma]MDC0666422.1 hypothetical protein [Nannocystis radixulma]